MAFTLHAAGVLNTMGPLQLVDNTNRWICSVRRDVWNNFFISVHFRFRFMKKLRFGSE